MSNGGGQINIYKCSSCDGKNSKCQQCQGLGRFLWLNGKIYFWGKKYSHFRINHERMIRRARILVNSAFFAFGIMGFLALVKVFYDLHTSGVHIYNFVYVRNDYTLVWWISALADMYLVYRISREAKIRFLIKKRPRYRVKNEFQAELEWDKIKKYKWQDISKSFNQESLEKIEAGWLFADKLKQTEYSGIHLFSVLLSTHQVNLVFSRLGVDYRKMTEKIKHSLNRIMEKGKTGLGVEINEILLESYERAYNERKNKVQATDLLYALAHHEGVVKEILYDMGITEREIANVTAWVDLHRKLIQKWHGFKYKAYFKPKNNMNRAYTAIATPNLNQISHDMTLYARSGAYSPCVGRKKEIGEIFRILEVDRLGAVLVGHPGVGKKTIIEGTAQLMAAEDVPEVLRDKRLVSMSVSGLIAGASKVGDLEHRVLTVMNEISRSKNIVLVIDDIHHLVGVSTDSGEAMDVAEVLAEQMQHQNFMVLATTTPEYYKQYLENSSLAKTLQKVIVEEPKQDEAIRIISARALELEARNEVYFSYQAIEEVVKLSTRYLHDEYLPEKALKILEEAALMVKQMKGTKATVGEEDVANVVSSKTNIPLTKIVKGERERLLNLEQRMHERVVGQEQAIKYVASALRRARTELREENRPIASFLFLGPTGVGKTEVAKTLAWSYFGSESNMVRVDMSEYQSGDALAKLIGHAASGKGGYLTEAVRKNPFSLILLDEIEKASFDILNVFLQVLDDGRLTDATGKTIDFTNSIIIATSNAGAEFIKDGIKQNLALDAIREKLIDQYLKQYFRPEFLNRFDGVAVFHPLEIGQVEEISKLFLNKLAKRLEDKGIGFKVDERAIKALAKMGYDPAMGARPLRRVIQDRVEDGLAKLFLAGEVQRRDRIVLKEDLEVEVEKAEKI